MTSTQPGGQPVDVDTLADYLEGVLPDEQVHEVDDLLANDPAWSSMLTALRDAQPAVAAALSAYATPAVTMPADVATRLEQAIRTPDRPANVVDLATHQSRRPRRGARSPRVWLEAAVIFVVVAIGAGLLIRLVPSGSTSHSSASARGAGTVQLSNPNAPPSLPGLSVTASGTDYTSASLGRVPPVVPGPTVTFGASRAPAVKGPETGAPQADAIPAALRRLLDPAALSDCIAAIESATGGTATSVDYARFEDRPALIVSLPTIGVTIAVGAACGQPGAGIAELGRA